MISQSLPELIFPGVPVGNGAAWNLNILLYRGGASIRRDRAQEQIESGALGEPITRRLPVVIAIHDEMTNDLVSGSTRMCTFHAHFDVVRRFYHFCDDVNEDATLQALTGIFCKWIEHLRDRVRRKVLKETTFYGNAAVIASIFGKVLELPSAQLLRSARVSWPTRSRAAIGRRSDQQDLAKVHAFCGLLKDLCDGLTESAILGPLPVVVTIGGEQNFKLWCGLSPPENLKTFLPGACAASARYLMDSRERRSNTVTLDVRSPLINRRIEAELLLFIAHTSMNLAQACALTLGDFRFQSSDDGYVVRKYKHRRRGGVEFEVLSAYRPIFERYLSWRSRMIPNEPGGRLFGLICRPGVLEDRKQGFLGIKSICRKLGVTYIPPRMLRKARSNWLLRASDDPRVVAELGQHSIATLLESYAGPSHQIALSEITRFWNTNDPFFSPPGPGACVDVNPISIRGAPDGAPTPDCISPSGCLFCEHHRDVDSLDYVWSLLSFRYLKTLELSKYRVLDRHGRQQPAAASIARVTEKLNLYMTKGSTRSSWVAESEARIAESDFHPFWSGFIELAELL